MSRQYLKDIAYENIKRMILYGEIKGPFITEQELVEMLEISRTPIREALQRLDNNDDLIEIVPKRGILIKELSVKETADLMDLRLAIELFSFRKSKTNLTSRHLEKLDQLVIEQKNLIENLDVKGFIKSDLEYHRVFLEIYDNEHFKKVLDNITDRIFLHGLKVFGRSSDRLYESYLDHVEINNHIRNDKMDSAEDTLENHIIKGKSIYLNDY